MRVIFALLFGLAITQCCAAGSLPLEKIHLPPGFSIQVYANDVPGARQLALGENGVVYVGSLKSGKIYALVPNAAHTQAEKIITIDNTLTKPTGVAFNRGTLYVSGTGKIIAYDHIAQQLAQPSKPRIVTEALPKKSHHGYRIIKFGPDGWLYAGVGMPCNTCDREGYFGTIVRLQPDGSNIQVYARGIRNSVGFDWEPKTKVLWFTDNGQDWLGDDVPPDEINRAPKQGMDFGFPYFYGNNVLAPNYKDKNISAQGMTPAAYDLPAHVAALGLTFYPGTMFPAQYHGAMFIAEHGSWNRTQKDGYQLITAFVQDGKVSSVKPFATGWLQDQSAWGRPVDTLVMPDGSLLVSDDYAGVVYRVAYQAPV